MKEARERREEKGNNQASWPQNLYLGPASSSFSPLRWAAKHLPQREGDGRCKHLPDYVPDLATRIKGKILQEWCKPQRKDPASAS